MQKILTLGVIVLCTISTWIFYPYIFSRDVVKKIYISQFVEHPALDMTTKGIIDGLEAQGYKRGVNLDLRVESLKQMQL